MKVKNITMIYKELKDNFDLIPISYYIKIDDSSYFLCNLLLNKDKTDYSVVVVQSNETDFINGYFIVDKLQYNNETISFETVDNYLLLEYVDNEKNIINNIKNYFNNENVYKIASDKETKEQLLNITEDDDYLDLSEIDLSDLDFDLDSSNSNEPNSSNEANNTSVNASNEPNNTSTNVSNNLNVSNNTSANTSNSSNVSKKSAELKYEEVFAEINGILGNTDIVINIDNNINSSSIFNANEDNILIYNKSLSLENDSYIIKYNNIDTIKNSNASDYYRFYIKGNTNEFYNIKYPYINTKNAEVKKLTFFLMLKVLRAIHTNVKTFSNCFGKIYYDLTTVKTVDNKLVLTEIGTNVKNADTAFLNFYNFLLDPSENKNSIYTYINFIKATNNVDNVDTILCTTSRNNSEPLIYEINEKQNLSGKNIYNLARKESIDTNIDTSKLVNVIKSNKEKLIKKIKNEITIDGIETIISDNTNTENGLTDEDKQTFNNYINGEEEYSTIIYEIMERFNPIFLLNYNIENLPNYIEEKFSKETTLDSINGNTNLYIIFDDINTNDYDSLKQNVYKLSDKTNVKTDVKNNDFIEEIISDKNNYNNKTIVAKPNEGFIDSFYKNINVTYKSLSDKTKELIQKFIKENNINNISIIFYIISTTNDDIKKINTIPHLRYIYKYFYDQNESFGGHAEFK